MQIIVRGHKLKITPAIRSFAQKKLQRMDRYFSNIQEVLVELEVQHIKDKAKRQIAHVTVKLAQGILRADESDQDIYTAIDRVFLKMEKQVKKHHEKLKSRRKKGQIIRGSKKLDVGGKGRSAGPKNVETKIANPLKPMDPKEAVLELKMDKSDFLIFQNAINGSMNVVYGLSGGGYGLYHAEPFSSQKKSLFSKLFGKLFKKKIDPAFGETAIKEIKALGNIRRMTREDAIDILQDNELKYFIYKDQDYHRLNVLYPVGEGRYRLIAHNI